MNFSAPKNNRETVNTNTRGVQFLNSESKLESSTLQFGFWNEMVSLKINPVLPEAQQTDSKKFDYDVTVSTALNLDKTLTLKKAIEEELIPAFNEGRDAFKGVPVSGTSVVGVGVKVVDEVPETYFAIFKNLDAETFKPSESLSYNFRTSYTIDDYNPETGDYKLVKGLPGELQLFARLLGAAVDALSNANAHAHRNVNRFSNDRQQKLLNDIASKVGVEVQGGYSNRGGYNKPRDVFGGGSDQSSNASNELEAETTKLTNVSDLNEFMN